MFSHAFESLFALGYLVAFLFFLMGIVSLRYTKNFSGFVAAAGAVTLTDAVGVVANPTILAAQAGVLTVRTSGTVGSLTMTSGSHGIITGQRVDLYWSGGSCYHAVVGTVSGSVVPIASVAGGDALPIATTAIKVGICINEPFVVDGDNITALLLVAPNDGYFVVATTTVDTLPELVAAGTIFEWTTNSAGANPLAGETPDSVWMSSSLTTGPTTTMQAVALTH